MNYTPTFSLIVPTLDRSQELDYLFESLFKQTFLDFEVIIIDQNDDDKIIEIINKYQDLLKINYIKSNKKGLSFNRNIGIANSSGNIICFPDDDCTYPQNTLENVADFFEMNPNAQIYSCCVMDDKTNQRFKMAETDSILTPTNYINKAISIGIFIKPLLKSDICFDEQLGVGAKFGSAEESDLISNLLNKEYRGNYFANHYIFHDFPAKTPSLSRYLNYGMGYGALVRKEICIRNKKIILFRFLFDLFIRLILSVIPSHKRIYYWYSLKGRIIGFFKYRVSISNQKKILFYSSVKSKKMFSIQQFYRTDICILRDLGYTVKLSNSFCDYLLFWNYDIAFIYFYRFGFLPALISKLFSKKVVFTGGIDYLDKEYAGLKSYTIQKIFFKLCNQFSDKNIIVSNSDIKNIQSFNKKQLSSKYPLSFHVIDFKSFEYHDIKKKEKIFCTIGWMVRQENVIRKGIDKSLKLFKEVHRFDNSYRMIIIGPQGEGTTLINKIIQEDKLDGLVTLTGAISEEYKIEILKKSTIYSQLSIYEGFGIAAIEALAAGNIVVHTGKGGLSDGIGNNGIQIKNENYDEIALRIINTTSNENAWLNMVENGIKHVSENFRYETRLHDFKNILSSLE